MLHLYRNYYNKQNNYIYLKTEICNFLKTFVFNVQIKVSSSRLPNAGILPLLLNLSVNKMSENLSSYKKENHLL